MGEQRPAAAHAASELRERDSTGAPGPDRDVPAAAMAAFRACGDRHLLESAFAPDLRLRWPAASSAAAATTS